MLTGRPPFEGSTIPETFAKTKKMQFSFPEYISHSARDLISAMLNFDPGSRLTPSQILAHSFFFDQESTEESFYEYLEAPLSCRNSELLSGKGKGIQNSLLSPINTAGLPSFVHEIKNGKIEITVYGWVKVAIGSKLLEISSDGSEIYFRNVKYSLKNLPSHAEKVYRYAEQCLNTIKSKTPKVIIEEEDAKFLLMSNLPDANFEAEYYNGIKVLYQIGKQDFTIQFLGKEKIVKINEEGKWFDVIQTTMQGLKKCMNAAKDR